MFANRLARIGTSKICLKVASPLVSQQMAMVAPRCFQKIEENYGHQFLSFSSSSGSRPFKVLGVQQIALGSTDKQGTNKLWHDIFGLQPESSHRLEKENEDILRVGAAKSAFAVEVDLMQPIDPEKSPKVI